MPGRSLANDRRGRKCRTGPESEPVLKLRDLIFGCYFRRFLRSEVFFVTRVAAFEDALAAGFFGVTFLSAIWIPPPLGFSGPKAGSD